ncbi:MAG: hypothetical protein ACFFEE_04940 [Candidatus Thorarchaeota archaeon]
MESLPHLPAPTGVPGYDIEEIVAGNLTLSVTGYFETMEPHIGPNTFSFTINVNVTNNGTTGIDDFNVDRVTIFYDNNTPVYTFGVVPSENTTIGADSNQILDYTKDRDMVVVPMNLLRAAEIFARVSIIFNIDTQVILTTPLTQIPYAIE